ncbi:MAG: protein kinase [Sandaracinaceae bacterium]|nr:protein kinase [Sandaracinaceae bacterium]
MERPRTSSIPPGIRSGLVLDETYELVRPLGEGAMGMVYLGRDVRLERDVAIKFIQPDLVRSPEAHERFLREARTMARVRHVNVVEIYAYGDLFGAPYFVMEYVPGSTVDGWMKLHARPHLLRRRGHRHPRSGGPRSGGDPPRRRGAPRSQADERAHRSAFRVCVTDLGLAQVLDRTREENKDTVSGTPAYMAPEVVLGTPLSRELEARSDVYSMGVMAFELFTGRLPFEHTDANEMMLAHVDEAPPVPSELREDLPSAFDGAILGALEKDPYRRTPSAEAFQRALLEARESASAPVRAISILIADDDADFRALASETLRFAFEDADVIAVSDGDQALRALERRPASLAIIDLDMPEMNGVEVTAAIRATPKLERMPILVVTATGGAPDWRLLQSLGADGFLVKPIDPVSLIALARRTIDHGRD